MKTGVCPKCKSDEIFVWKASNGSFQYFNYLPIRNWWGMGHLRIDTYVCANCGYIEQYLPDKESARKIADSWERADGRPKRKRKTDE